MPKGKGGTLKASKAEVLKKGYFTLARNEATKVDHHIRVGAVLATKRCPVAVGKNSPLKTHPLVSSYNPLKTVHAEFDAIIGIDRSLVQGGTMYVYREKFSGELGMAKPCPMCEAFLKHMGLKRVYYTTEDGYDVLNFKDVPSHKQGELREMLRAENVTRSASKR